MRKNGWLLALFVLIGLIGGSLLSDLLAPVAWLSWLTSTISLSWEPRADLNFITYDIQFGFYFSLMTFIGFVLAIWVYKKW